MAGGCRPRRRGREAAPSAAPETGGKRGAHGRDPRRRRHAGIRSGAGADRRPAIYRALGGEGVRDRGARGPDLGHEPARVPARHRAGAAARVHGRVLEPVDDRRPAHDGGQRHRHRRTGAGPGRAAERAGRARAAGARAAQAGDALGRRGEPAQRGHAAHVRGRGPGAGRRPAPGGSHPAAKVCAGPDRDGDGSPAGCRFPGYRSAFRGREPAALLHGGVRLAGAVGRRRRAVPPVHRPIRALPGAGEMTSPTEHLDPALRVEALASLLTERGLLDEATVETFIKTYEQSVGPMNGAKVVAKAWTDPEYRARLLADGTAAIAELGFKGPQGEHIVVLENTPTVHHVVVCTLCSCYPWPVLGLPPSWYKDPAYRSRIVREPRRVLSEFGLDLDDNVEIRVHDSSSEVRYMVLPERPAGTGNASEEELAALVTRDAMVGVAKVTAP